MLKFIRQRRSVRLLKWLSGFLLALFIHLFILVTVSGNIFSFADADNLVNLSQEIKPFNPVDETGELAESVVTGNSLEAVSFRVVTPLDDVNTAKSEMKSKTEKRKVKPIVTLRGNSIYPNSRVILEIESDKFITSTISDQDGHWRWTNFGHLLDEGEHEIEMYNVSPFELSGNRDVYFEKYKIEVDPQLGSLEPDEVILANYRDKDYEEKKGDGDLGDRFLINDIGSIYLFDIIVLNKKEYSPGESMNLQLNLQSLGQGKPTDGRIKYEIFSKDESLEKIKSVSSFEDIVKITGSNSLIKKIKFKKQLFSGEYIIKVTALMEGDEYIQSTLFSLGSEKIIQIGGASMTRDGLTTIASTNIIVLLAIIIFILIMIILEFRRFIVCAPVGEEVLKKRGYY